MNLANLLLVDERAEEIDHHTTKDLLVQDLHQHWMMW